MLGLSELNLFKLLGGSDLPYTNQYAFAALKSNNSVVTWVMA